MFCFCGKKKKREKVTSDHQNLKQIDSVIAKIKNANSTMKTITLMSADYKIVTNLTDIDFQSKIENFI